MGSNSWQHAHDTTLKLRLRRCVAGVAIGLLVATPAVTTLAVDLEVPDPVAAAVAEASGWPDFDPSDMTEEVAATEAQQAVAGWPDFDPSDMSQEVAITEAQQEAASWPNYDSTALADPSNQIVIASGSPRMAQIAASQAQANQEGAPVAAGPNTSTF
jgi:hypothetical protein